MSYIQWKPNQPANVSLPVTDQVMATWDPEPRAPHLKAWLEQTSALGEEGELPEGGPWPQVVDSLLFLVKSPQLLGLLGAGHWSFPIVPSTASPVSGTPAASTSFVPDFPHLRFTSASISLLLLPSSTGSQAPPR